MMIDNFDRALELMKFGENTYYYLQIITRRKDAGNEGLKTLEQQRWSKFITSREELIRIKEDVIGMCRLFNARAYLELNPRCLERFSIKLTKRMLDRIYLRDFKHISNLRNKIALLDDTIKTRGVTDQRRWTIDVDNLNDLETIKEWVTERKINIISELPTPNGIHILIAAFNYKSLGIELDREFSIKEGIKTTIKSFANSVLFCDI